MCGGILHHGKKGGEGGEREHTRVIRSFAAGGALQRVCQDVAGRRNEMGLVLAWLITTCRKVRLLSPVGLRTYGRQCVIKR